MRLKQGRKNRYTVLNSLEERQGKRILVNESGYGFLVCFSFNRLKEYAKVLKLIRSSSQGIFIHLSFFLLLCEKVEYLNLWQQIQ